MSEISQRMYWQSMAREKEAENKALLARVERLRGALETIEVLGDLKNGFELKRIAEKALSEDKHG